MRATQESYMNCSHSVGITYDSTDFGSYIIEYGLPYQAEVQVKIFNVLGQNVATLVRANQAAGNHQIGFNPKDFRLPNGQYFYRIQAGTLKGSGAIGVW